MRSVLRSVTGALTLVIATAAGAQAHKSAAGATQPATAPTATTTVPQTTTTTDAAAPGQSAMAPGQTGNTPGQQQSTPGEASQLTPAVTGLTPSGQTTGTATTTSGTTTGSSETQTPQVTAATAADIKAGVSVYDQKGALVGKITSTSAKGTVLDTGVVKATIPTSSFAKSDKGLVIALTKAELDAKAKTTATTNKK